MIYKYLYIYIYITEEQLIKNDTLWDRTEWKPGHIIELPLGSQFQSKAGIFGAWFENLLVKKGKSKALFVF